VPDRFELHLRGSELTIGERQLPSHESRNILGGVVPHAQDFLGSRISQNWDDRWYERPSVSWNDGAQSSYIFVIADQG